MIYSIIQPIVKGINLSPSPPQPRYAPYFDGLTQHMVLAERAIDVEGDINIEFWTPSFKAGRTQTIISQATSPDSREREFDLLSNGNNQLRFLCCGNGYVTLAEPDEWRESSKYRLTLIGTTLSLTEIKTQATVSSFSFTRGSAREPGAVTLIGVREYAGINSWFEGLMPDIKINGTYWSLNQRNNPVQPSIPAGNDLTIINHTDAMWREI